MRTEKEIRNMIASIEETYPNHENEAIGWNPIKAYQLGIHAGLKSAVGDYESFAEIDLEEFMKANFDEVDKLRTEEEQEDLNKKIRARNRDGRWRKKRSDTGKPRRKKQQ